MRDDDHKQESKAIVVALGVACAVGLAGCLLGVVAVPAEHWDVRLADLAIGLGCYVGLRAALAWWFAKGGAP